MNDTGDKKSFLLYTTDQTLLKWLTDEQYRKVVDWIFDYAGNDVLPDLEQEDRIAGMAFEAILEHIRADREAYEQKCERNRANASERKRTVATASENERPQATASERKQYDNDYDNDSLKKSISKDMPKEKRFAPPSVEEVREYATEHGFAAVEAERFCDFYESKGWMVGKTKMKDWKAAVRNWNRSQREESPKAVRQETTAKRTRFVNYDQRQVDYDAMLREGDWR